MRGRGVGRGLIDRVSVPFVRSMPEGRHIYSRSPFPLLGRPDQKQTNAVGWRGEGGSKAHSAGREPNFCKHHRQQTIGRWPTVLDESLGHLFLAQV